MIKRAKVKNKWAHIFLWLIIVFLFLVASVVDLVFDWFNLTFEVGFEEILFTITSPLKGTGTSFFDEALRYVLSTMLQSSYWIVIIILLAIIAYKFMSNIEISLWGKRVKIDIHKTIQVMCLIFSIGYLISVLHYGYVSLDIESYIARRLEKTTIYEEYYIAPEEVVSLVDEPKNIIYIYMESLETAYASTDMGGAQSENYIPNLTKLAQDNISFSDTSLLGGAEVTKGATWTMGGLFATTTGIPFSFPVEGNSMGKHEKFAEGVTSLGDVLDDFGYNQVFICGSDAKFAARKEYFEQHGNYEVIDYCYALEHEYIPSDYHVWWGYEDQKLYDIAKKEVLKLVEKDEPFNCTLLTVDTHPMDGYICELCDSTYDQVLENVLVCADNQIYEFVLWCQQQDFYENTVIVITGDHCRMDAALVKGENRRLYNCIINSDTEVLGSTQYRVFTSLDFFPTTLSAMGFKIEGNRLGLGTDLFSETKTIAEEIGFDVLNEELSKYSDFYIKTFE